MFCCYCSKIKYFPLNLYWGHVWHVTNLPYSKSSKSPQLPCRLIQLMAFTKPSRRFIAASPLMERKFVSWSSTVRGAGCTHLNNINTSIKFSTYNDQLLIFCLSHFITTSVSKGRDVPGQTGTGRPVVPLSRDKKKFLSRCPIVPGQGQEQMSRDKLLCPGPSRDKTI